MKRVIGVIPDLHIPFNHKNSIPFLLDTFKKEGVTDIVFIGDLVDNHAISRHQTDAIALGAKQEYEEALLEVHKFTKAFPNLRMPSDGNHDDIPERQAATLGMPTEFLKEFRDLWQLPKGWKIEDELIIDGILFKHKPSAGGANGCFKSCLIEGMSVVFGHLHSVFGIRYYANKRSLKWAMAVGCLINIKDYAFNYGKDFAARPILGCGIIKNGVPKIIPMPDKYFK